MVKLGGISVNNAMTSMPNDGKLSLMPKKIERNTDTEFPKFPAGRRKRMTLRRLSKTRRPFRIASRIEEKLLSMRTSWLASMATSLPLPIAMPTSADLSAGASLTPSPVTPTM